MARRGIQQNNGSPMGYGQPDKGMRKRLLRPEDEQAMGMSPDQQDNIQQFNEPQPAYQSQVMPGRQPIQGVPQTFALGMGKHVSENPGLLSQQERDATQGLAQYYQQQQQQPSVMNRAKQALSDPRGLTGQWNQQPQQQGGLYDAFKQSVANGYTDIAGTEGWKVGQYGGQLQGFGDLNSTDRGSNTLKKSMGKILSDYDVTQPGVLQQVLKDPRVQELTGGQATIVDHPNMDQIDFDGPGPMQPVDLIGNAVEGGAGSNWWWGTDTGGPQAPANQIYDQAFMMPGMEQLDQNGIMQQMQQSPDQAMQFLQWLLQQQQQGQLMNGGIGQSPVTF